MNSASHSSSRRPWAIPADDLLQAHKVDPDRGLDAAEIKTRRKQHGPNRLRAMKRRSAWFILIDQFKSLITLLLAAAVALSILFAKWLEAVAIAIALLVNALIGFFTELKAVRSMEALSRLSQVKTRVRREGAVKEVPASDLVHGDIVILEAGDIVAADLRLLEANKLQADESTLTGESIPVSKQVEPLEEDAPLAERRNMLFKGTAVTRGSGEGLVVATGMETELGSISSLVEEAQEEKTPLERRLDRLGYRLIWVTVALASVIGATGYLTGKEIFLVIETAIALAVAAIPEGLPIVATLSLARGMHRMAARHALVRQLSAMETLGSTNVIFTDKTGTLTENRLTVTRLALPTGEIEVRQEEGEESGRFFRDGDPVDAGGDAVLREALEVGVLCNNASLTEGDDSSGRAVGDPLEVALLIAGDLAGLRRQDLLERLPEVREVAFDPEVKMMATFHRDEGAVRVAVKGAPEEVLEASSSLRTGQGKREFQKPEKEQWLEVNDRLAADGLRVLALAAREAASPEDEPYENLTFLGLVGMLDPPRREVPPAIKACRESGIRVIMVTGDQPVTARHVGRAVGLVDDDEVRVVQGQELERPEAGSQEERRRLLQVPIFARVSPKAKLDLIDLHQQHGAIVAMTGDGVNDAPALKKADIGVAMGQRGTQVAKEAADMVLTDDSFNTIVLAIEQGRTIFASIRKFIIFLLSGNVSEILVVALAWLANAPLPLLPLQILYLNMIGDVFPALALGVGRGNPARMRRPPRDPREPILTRRHWHIISAYGVLIAAVVLGTFALALGWLGKPSLPLGRLGTYSLDLGQGRIDGNWAVTISFLTLAFSRLWHVFNMRDAETGWLRNDITRNPFIWWALALCTLLLLLAVYIPELAAVLKLVDPGRTGWLLIISASLVPLLIGQISKTISRKMGS